MGIRNYLIEGVSSSGKTAVCRELARRGYHAINGDRELGYKGDPATGKPVTAPIHANEADEARWTHAHHVWDIEKVKAAAADQRHAATFFCGGSRNVSTFIHLFDLVFVLEIDETTLNSRLAARPDDEFGGRQPERELIQRLHASRADTPKCGLIIDATQPLEHVVDAILSRL